MNTLSYKGRHRIKNINGSLFHLPMLLLILLSILPLIVRVIGVVIEVVCINFGSISSSETILLGIVLGNAKALIHGKDICCKVHHGIPVLSNHNSLSQGISVLIVSKLRFKESLGPVNHVVDAYSLYYLLP